MCNRTLLEMPTPISPETPFLPPKQTTALAHTGSLHVRVLILFLVGAGCRPTEALELHWRHVDLKGGHAILFLGKIGRKRLWSPCVPSCCVRWRRFRTGTSLCSGRGSRPRRIRGPTWSGIKAGASGRLGVRHAPRAGLPDEWHERTNKHGRKLKCYKPVHNPCSERHTFGSWQRCRHGNLQDLVDEVGWTTTRMGGRSARKVAPAHRDAIHAW
jgi:hypothetical protein